MRSRPERPAGPRLSRVPVEKSSSTVTVSPAETRWSTKVTANEACAAGDQDAVHLATRSAGATP